MIELNEHAKKAQEIALNRHFKHNVPNDSPALLKHMAGEVVESTEAYNNFLYENSQVRRDKLAGELADVITCALIIAANEKINIEQALKDCQAKNAGRAKE